jgi:hypothetical protein
VNLEDALGFPFKACVDAGAMGLQEIGTAYPLARAPRDGASAVTFSTPLTPCPSIFWPGCNPNP